MTELNFKEPWLKVLDQGFVRLVDSMGSDARIVQAARVSYGSGTKAKRSDAGLIRYLINNRHNTPLEKVVFEWHVALPISCARQWMRHRTWSYNEVSTRYSEVDQDRIYVPELERMRAQDGKDRQASGELLVEKTRWDIKELILAQAADAHATYKQLLELGLAREIARGVLPLDTYTEFYGTVNLSNLMRFLELRLDPHAQWELRQYGKALLELARPVAPVAIEAWENTR